MKTLLSFIILLSCSRYVFGEMLSITTQPVSNEVQSSLTIDGVTMMLRMPASSPIGKPIAVHLQIQNRSNAPVGRIGDGIYTSIEVFDMNHHAIGITSAGIAASKNTNGAGKNIEPGETEDFECDLGSWFQLRNQQCYQIQITRMGLSVNGQEHNFVIVGMFQIGPKFVPPQAD